MMKLLVLSAVVATAFAAHGYSMSTTAARNYDNVEKFWHDGWLSRDLAGAVKKTFTKNADYCDGLACVKGHAAITETLSKWGPMMKGMHMHMSNVLPSTNDAIMAGTWSNAYKCKSGDGRPLLLSGSVFAMFTKSGKVSRFIVSMDTGSQFDAAFRCMLEIPRALVMPPVNKAMLDDVMAADMRRWAMVFSKNRVSDDELATLWANAAGEGFEFCVNSPEGCLNLDKTVALMTGFRSIVSDMVLKIDNVQYGNNAVGCEWSAAYICAYDSDMVIALSGTMHIVVDDNGKYLKYYDAWDQVSSDAQLAACAARAGGEL